MPKVSKVPKQEDVEIAEFRRWVGVADRVTVLPVVEGWAVQAETGDVTIGCVKRRGGRRTWNSLDRVYSMLTEAGCTQFEVITEADLFGGAL